MLRFIRNVLLIFIIIWIILLGNIIFAKQIINSRALLEIGSDKTTIVLGDSHTECALNDSIIPYIVNFSKSSDFYLYSFVKLRTLIEHNPHVKNIILAYSYDSLPIKHDKNIVNDKYINYKLTNYYFLMTLPEVCGMILSNPKSGYNALMQSVKSSFKIMAKIIFKDMDINDLDIGGYLSLERNKLQQDKMRRKEIQNETFEFSKMQKKYILRIYNMCLINDINLILFNSPLYKAEELYEPDLIKELYEFYEKDLNQAVFINYQDFSLPDVAYGDCTHLNWKGAKILSEYILNSECELNNILNLTPK